MKSIPIVIAFSNESKSVTQTEKYKPLVLTTLLHSSRQSQPILGCSATGNSSKDV